MGVPEITLFELAPTRSSRVRWALLEAQLPFESVGNDVSIIGSQALRQVHPLGKLPAAVIDGRPLFESSAILAAVADLVAEKRLIARPATWSRYLHDQWVSFAQSEMEAFVQSSEVNSIDFILPESQHVADILPQNDMFYRKAAAALNDVLGESEYLVDNRFLVTDIYVGYVLHWGEERQLLEGFGHLQAYLARLLAREHCPWRNH